MKESWLTLRGQIYTFLVYFWVLGPSFCDPSLRNRGLCFLQECVFYNVFLLFTPPDSVQSGF